MMHFLLVRRGSLPSLRGLPSLLRPLSPSSPSSSSSSSSTLLTTVSDPHRRLLRALRALERSHLLPPSTSPTPSSSASSPSSSSSKRGREERQGSTVPKKSTLVPSSGEDRLRDFMRPNSSEISVHDYEEILMVDGSPSTTSAVESVEDVDSLVPSLSTLTNVQQQAVNADQYVQNPRLELFEEIYHSHSLSEPVRDALLKNEIARARKYGYPIPSSEELYRALRRRVPPSPEEAKNYSHRSVDDLINELRSKLDELYVEQEVLLHKIHFAFGIQEKHESTHHLNVMNEKRFHRFLRKNFFGDAGLVWKVAIEEADRMIVHCREARVEIDPRNDRRWQSWMQYPDDRL